MKIPIPFELKQRTQAALRRIQEEEETLLDAFMPSLLFELNKAADRGSFSCEYNVSEGGESIGALKRFLERQGYSVHVNLISKSITITWS